MSILLIDFGYKQSFFNENQAFHKKLRDGLGSYRSRAEQQTSARVCVCVCTCMTVCVWVYRASEHKAPRTERAPSLSAAKQHKQRRALVSYRSRVIAADAG